MNDFSYSAIRSFNQYLNSQFTATATEQLVLNPYPGHVDLSSSKDTVSVHFYDSTIEEIGGGRWAGGSRGRFVNLYCQIDVWSPPNSSGEARNGANRKLKDKVEDCLKDKTRIDLLSWDGTGGTTLAGGMYVRQQGASWIPTEGEDNYCRWSLDYRVRAVDHET